MGGINVFTMILLVQGTPSQGLKDRRWVAFMLNFPLYMPLPAEQVARIGRTVKAWQLDLECLHCGWTGQSVDRNAKQVDIKSAEHYVGLLDGTLKRELFLMSQLSCRIIVAPYGALAVESVVHTRIIQCTV